MRVLYTLILSTLFCLTINAQSVWTGDVDTDWSNSANWVGGVPTAGTTATIPGTPQGGNFPVYGGSPIIDFTIQNSGSITFNGFVYNNGTIINFTQGTLINNNNYFVNAGSVIFDNDGDFTNTGTFENFGTFDNAASATFTNEATASLINHGFFRNNGLVENDGTITNYGDFRSTDVLTNNGTFENEGKFESPNGSAITNASNASINNSNGATFYHNDVFQNNGSITNSGIFGTENSGTLTNDGTITNQDDLQISGTILNNTTITNNGIAMINNAGTLNNKNNFANNGTVETDICGIIIQDSPIDIAATVLHDGLLYELQGNVDETTLEFGEVFTDINQTKPPVPGCKSGFTLVLDENGLGTLTVADVDKGGYGQCGATLVNKTLNITEFTIDDLGAQLVTLTVEDNFGLTASCDAVIFVVEYVPPIVEIDDPDIEFACPEDITITPEPGQSFVAVNWDEPGDATTNCAGSGEICASRTASNTTQCNGGQVYGFYFKFTGLDYFYAISNGELTEYEDGTATFTAHVTNSSNSNYQFDLEYNLTGRTFNAPAGSPKENICGAYDASDWSYYTDGTGILTGTNGMAGALVNISDFGEAFQIGNGANATDGTNGFGASGWLAGSVVSQPNNGPNLVIENVGNPQAGDINIMLSGNGNECRPMEQCSETPNDIPGFIFLGEFNDSKYYCSNTNDYTWHNAKAEAEANGGHLVIVDDMAENNFLQDGVIADYAWIGLTDEVQEGQFVWVDGMNASFTNWSSGEPNNSGGIEHYTRLLKSNGMWTDRDQHFLAEFIMEIPCSNAAPSCADVSNDKPGFTFLGEYNDGKYYVSNTAATWDVAKVDCEANGGHLVVINDASENNYVQSNINPASGSIWTGFSTVYSPNVWNWVTNEPVNYTNWQVGEPNGNGYDQAARMKKSTGEWTDRGAYDFYYEYVMEIPCDDTPPPPPTSSEPVVEQISGPLNGADFFVGETEIAYEVTDDCGNQEICIFTVTVEENPAEIIATCPADITVDAAPGAPSAVVTWDDPTGTSTCYIPGVAVSQIDSNYFSGDELPVGVTFIPFNLIDSCNNFAQCLLTVTVNGQDAALTLNTCPGDINTDTDNFSWDDPTASTTCYTGNVTIEQVSGPANGSNPGEGTYEIAYLINDECGNSEVCVFNVVVGTACPAQGTPCDDGDDCTTGDVEDGDCNCAGTFTDSDGDGVCDADDICAGGDDTVDTDGDGTPDFCDDCSTVGQPCNDGDACTTNDMYDENCNCVGTPTGDSDGDGVCDEEDICEGGDDTVDTDGDGVPDFCDDCSTVGQPCDDGDNCTPNSFYNANCECVGTIADSDGDGVCDEEDICEGGDDGIDTDGDGTPDFCDDDQSGDPCENLVITLGPGNVTVSNVNAPIFNVYVFNSSWGTEYNCNYACTDPTSIDLAAGTYFIKVSLRDASWNEICEVFESIEIIEGCPFNAGDACDDGDACTTGDVYDANCNCAGTYVGDTDGDGVCNVEDICEGGDDNVDTDGDGTPDFCDTSVDLPILSINDITVDENVGTTTMEVCINVAYGEDVAFGFATEDGTAVLNEDYTALSGTGVITAGETCVDVIIPIEDNLQEESTESFFVNLSALENATIGDGQGEVTILDDDAVSTNPCDDVSISTGAGSITVSNINAPIYNIFVFNSGWGTEFNCNYACTDPTTIDLAPGTYHVKVSLRDASWNEICEIFETFVVSESCPFNEGDACDDGDACTTGDAYDANCNCVGTATADTDGDGVCDTEDICEGGDDNADMDGDGIPDYCDTCNDNDGDGVCNDMDICEGGDDTVDSDGDGTPDFCDDDSNSGDPCADIVVTTGNGSITVSNVNAPIFTLLIFNEQWQMVYNCGYDCASPETATDLPAGEYHISIKLYDENWTFICESTPRASVANTGGYIAGENIFDFQATKNGRTVRTYWMTNTETINDHFVLERSSDGTNFEALSDVSSITNSTGAFNYFESDADPFLGNNFYRLKKVHHDGSFDYSVIKRVAFDLDLSATAIFPNPATNEVYVDLQDYEGRTATISVFNHLGQRMDFRAFDELNSNPIRFDLSKYTGGAYTMYINVDGTKNIARTFIVSKL